VSTLTPDTFFVLLLAIVDFFESAQKLEI